jgi:hypothetical protein
MSLVKIRELAITESFVAEEPIGNLHVVYISTGGRSVKEGDSTTQHLVGGVAVGGDRLSGALVKVVTKGIVSGVVCGALVSAGDRVTCCNLTSGGGLASGKGLITPINTITPAGTLAGALNLMSGLPVLSGGALNDAIAVTWNPTINKLGVHSGVHSGVGDWGGTFTGTAFNTQRVLGKALDNGGIGSGIRLLVALGG